MKILNFGSLNLDHSYQVHHFVQPGETLSATVVETSCGGKGLNQSVALARAGVEVWQGGCLGQGGEMLCTLLQQNGVHTECLKRVNVPQGHAIIQRDSYGENCILLYGGSNRVVTANQIEETMKRFSPGDLLLLQNEVNALPELLTRGRAHGMTIALNPSPCDQSLKELDLSCVSWLILNEKEMEQLSGCSEGEAGWTVLHKRWPQMKVVLTLGAKGCKLFSEKETLYKKACRVPVVDTTGAGDTFTGFFLAAVIRNMPLHRCLDIATRAASISVMHKGAADSIPTWEEVLRECENYTAGAERNNY